MLKLKPVRVILIILGVVLVGLTFFLFVKQPITTDAALATPPPREDTAPKSTPHSSSSNKDSSNSEGDDNYDKKDDEGNLMAAIYGQVIDLSTGQPGRGLEIDINGSIVKTDDEGHYSLTGLRTGYYTAVLILPDQASAAHSAATIHLPNQEIATVDLNYYSQEPPTPVPTSEAAPTLDEEQVSDDEAAAFSPVAEAVLPNAGNTQAVLSPLVPHTGGNPVVWINPSHINNEKGVAGHIAIDVANVNDLGAFQAMLTFDPKIIEIKDVTLGNFLESTGRQTNPLVTEIDNTAGQISFVAFTYGEVGGPNGGGTLAVVDFVSKQVGVSTLDLNDVALVARLGKSIDAGVVDGQISVTVCFGDLNGDRLIDVRDVQAVSGRVGQSLKDANYILEYDLNNNKIIDETDVNLIINRLYETCP